MNRIIKKLKCKNILTWSIDIKANIGIDVWIIEILPTISYSIEVKYIQVKWLIFYVEFSAERKR